MNSPNVADSLEELLGIQSKASNLSKKNELKSEQNSELKSEPNSGPNSEGLIGSKQIPPLTVIKIRRTALEKIFILAQAVECVFGRPLEVYCICIGEKDIITDILIPKQYITYTSINIQAEHILELAPEIRENQLQVLGWAHSHANFGVFFSGTDDRNQLTLLNDTANYIEVEGTKIKFVYGMTVNTHGNVFGMVSTQYISGEIQHVTAEFEIEDDLTENWVAERVKQEIVEILRKKAHISSYLYSEIEPNTNEPDLHEI